MQAFPVCGGRCWQGKKEFLSESARGQGGLYGRPERHFEALEALVARYRDAASDAGNTAAAESLTRLLSDAPHTLRDALQMQRIIHFTMWCAGNYHNTLGRFDQYMMPLSAGGSGCGKADGGKRAGIAGGIFSYL